MSRILSDFKPVQEQTKMARLFKAISHTDRIYILKLLFEGENGKHTVKSIYETLHMLQPIVSRHLGILKSAGVVRREQEGQKVYYSACMDKEEVVSLFKYFFSYSNQPPITLNNQTKTA